MPWKITVSKNVRRCELSAPIIRRLAASVLASAPLGDLPEIVREVEILVVSDSEIHALNRDYRNKDKPTDVLSFSMLEGGGLVGSQLGSIVISWDTTLKQAERFKVTPAVEFIRLLVHGVLHLLGFDHEGVPPRAAARMRRVERRIQGIVAESID